MVKNKKDVAPIENDGWVLQNQLRKQVISAALRHWD